MSQENETATAMELFFKQFGDMDIYSQIVLEEFFKELLNEKAE